MQLFSDGMSLEEISQSRGQISWTYFNDTQTQLSTTSNWEMICKVLIQFLSS